MKKSWHVGLHSNQAKVWEKEKEALEERKRTAELQKELAQERAVQELQRLQEQAGGKRREERVDWMYAAPAEGNGPNAEELEQYLLGKKRVDKLLKGNEEKVSSPCVLSSLKRRSVADLSSRLGILQLLAKPSNDTPGSFTSIQNANSARDTAAKIREDPLLAIKRQEQLQYEKILKNPKRLKELRAAREASQRGSATPSAPRDERKSKKDETKEERRARKEAKRSGGGDDRDRDHKRSRREDEDRYSSSRRRSRSPESRRHYDDRSRDDRDRRDREDYRRSSDHSRRDDVDRPRGDYDSRRPRSRSPPPPPRDGPSSYHRSPPRDSYSSRPYDRPPPHSNGHSNGYSRPPPPPRPSAPAPPSAEDEAARKAAVEARLAAMQSSAASLNAARDQRLAELEAKEAEQLAREVKARESGRDVGPRFLREQEKKVFGGGEGGLAERIRRTGGRGMVGDRE